MTFLKNQIYSNWKSSVWYADSSLLKWKPKSLWGSCLVGPNYYLDCNEKKLYANEPAMEMILYLVWNGDWGPKFNISGISQKC